MDTRGYIDAFISEAFKRGVENVEVMNDARGDEVLHLRVNFKGAYKYHHQPLLLIAQFIEVAGVARIEADMVCDALGLPAVA